ncbi:MAG: iron-sulfur cluster assembly scaffold protein [Dehalococcoidales bacterium]|nr:iron-sulfur cluster assembly scaffold protein [Dehalococcoidales bacterium]
MSDGLDELEELLSSENRKTYSAKVIDHAMNPRNLGLIENADGYAGITGPCGDTMKIWLKVDNDQIAKAGFMTDGCGTSIASGSMVTELATGKDISEALLISQQNILDALNGLPEENKHCALLASNTLKAAIKVYMDVKKEPWKKAYRK